ncbi:MAG: hypothetical protein LQ337_002134 [Flavoplaca oasis]|nr:MAG: hypothetical protein LQ337_002134 [Flavoplaca oasis]
MPSLLRNSILPSSIETSAIVRKAAPSPPQKKQKMSLTQTYYLAHTARGKLSKEAARADHNLGRLVGHANLLDGLMLDLADAEREQENWFNQTVKGATKATDSPRHIQWADTVESAIEEEEDEDEDEYSDNESDSDDEVEQIPQIPARRLRQEVAPTPIVTIDEDSDEEMMDDDEGEELTLTRTHSNQPPELLHESDSESDDDMPPSPPQPEMPLDAFSEKQRQAIATTDFYRTRREAVTSAEDQASFFEEGFFIPPRQQAPSISAF